MDGATIGIIAGIVVNIAIVSFGGGKLYQKVSDLCRDVKEVRNDVKQHLTGKDGMHKAGG